MASFLQRASRRGAARLRGVASGGLALLAACAPAVTPPRPGTGILVVVVDALRADHVSANGYERETTPRLDRLMEEGASFTEAFSAAPLVLPAHVSLLTGCAPIVARRLIGQDHLAAPELRWRIPGGAPRLAVELLAAGYRTAAFMDHPRLVPLHGFGAGFEEFVEAEGDEQVNRTTSTTRRTVDRFLQWLRGVGRNESWFAYVHVNDLDRLWNMPDPQWDEYFPPRDGPARVPPTAATDSVFFAVPNGRWSGGVRSVQKYEAMYDGRLRAVDTELDRLFANLALLRRYESTTIAVVGSTGVQFGEAGLYLESGMYALADLHVPWILKPDRELGIAPGTRAGGVVSSTDVAPTLLELAGLAIPEGTHGVSQAAVLRGEREPAAERVVFGSCGLFEGCVAIGQRYVYELSYPERADATRSRSWFGSVEPTVEEHGRFYDRLQEAHPSLAPNAESFVPADEEEARRFARMGEAAESWMKRMRWARQFLQLVDGPGDAALPRERVEELRQLGYIAP